MRFVVVPNTLADAINAAIDRELSGRPCDAESREIIFNQVLAYFDEHGRLPDFSLNAREQFIQP